MVKKILKIFFNLVSLSIFIAFIMTKKVMAEWKRYINNPIIPDNVDKKNLIMNSRSPTLIYENNLLKMWFINYINNKFCLDYIISKDGISWKKPFDNPILLPENDERDMMGPNIIKINNVYNLWYGSYFISEKINKIRYAYSTDGINWEKYSSAILEPKYWWEEKGLYNPYVLFNNNQYYMFYSAWGNDGLWRIGLAKSTDKINWIRLQNPLNISPNILHVGNFSLKFFDNKFHLFYLTGNTINEDIYELTSIDAINWECEKSDCLILRKNQNEFPREKIDDSDTVIINNEVFFYFSGIDNGVWKIGLATKENFNGITKPTIILLPGLMGSWNGKAIIHNDEVSIFDWKIPSFVKEYSGIITSLQNLGYQENQDFFVFPYDWRKPIEKTTNDLNTFLEQKIWQENPDQKVNLIGHSLGGLVSRIFAQKNKEKVNQIISVGSPHQGVIQVYKPLQAGEIDRENTFLWLAQKLILILNKSTIEPDRETIKNRFPVALDLFPTFNFLKNKDGQEILVNTLSIKNNTLNTYNSSFYQVFNLFTAIYGEKDQNTPAGYIIDSPNILDQLLGNYTDGKPVDIWYEKGDYTVLSKSANQDTDAQMLNFDHGEIITEKNSIKKILDILNINYSDDKIISGQKTKISPSLIFLIRSPAKMKVLFGEQIYEEEDGIIFIPDAQSGIYQLQVQGIGWGEYNVIIGQIAQNNDIWEKVSGEIEKVPPDSQIDNYFINFNNQNANSIFPTPTPTNIITSNPVNTPFPTFTPPATPTPTQSQSTTPIPTTTLTPTITQNKNSNQSSPTDNNNLNNQSTFSINAHPSFSLQPTPVLFSSIKNQSSEEKVLGEKNKRNVKKTEEKNTSKKDGSSLIETLIAISIPLISFTAIIIKKKILKNN